MLLYIELERTARRSHHCRLREELSGTSLRLASSSDFIGNMLRISRPWDTGFLGDFFSVGGRGPLSASGAVEGSRVLLESRVSTSEMSSAVKAGASVSGDASRERTRSKPSDATGGSNCAPNLRITMEGGLRWIQRSGERMAYARGPRRP